MKNISLKSLGVITLGNLTFALAVNLFLVSNHMGEGGITGVSILLKYAFNIDPSLTYFGINAVLLVLGYKLLDRTRIGYTLYSIASFTLFLRLTNQFHYHFQDIMLVPIVGGVVIGASIGFVLLAGGSTAGTDIIALILQKYLHIPTSVGLFIIDLFIIIPGAFIIGFEKTIYTLIMLAISTKVLDFILEGLNPKKSAIIISNQYEAIAQAISDKIGRGVTIFNGEGFYSKQGKKILYVVVDRRQIINLSRLVSEIDSTAFMTISHVSSVSGEGFTYHLSPDTSTSV
ncbi:YitT family protein [Carnobacteriaceae bacterium zg-ZUI252]|nr:YitT family protein [Carnobacteriaceae bacterium zg-ZUI252]MBS4770005.1 YitT family protein [Carnobacteriaceae bacterium zg-ZUI240]QTU83230.1 YitT family protein [Carnobacteriaceae bacterium zg-C25]